VVTAVLIRIHYRRVVWNRLSQNALTGDLVAVPDHRVPSGCSVLRPSWPLYS